MIKWIRLFNTLRHLRFSQIIYRVYYRFRRLRSPSLATPHLRRVITGWDNHDYRLPASDDGISFTFLGETAELTDDWNSSELPKLWLYNLHYLDDLNCRGATSRAGYCDRLVDNWIRYNPPYTGNGWEPYCISLRVVNLIKWLWRTQRSKYKSSVINSLAIQVDALNQQLEYHILGNHLFANAKALVFAGVFFGGEQGDRWLRRGLKVLSREVPEQFLDDGAHFELSPMYHAILLWDLADLICLQHKSKMAELEAYKAFWKARFISGITWLRKMVHPDQEISFFNDATLGIAPTLEDLESYA
jgi:uncharacterized heparinase superfamily protein